MFLSIDILQQINEENPMLQTLNEIMDLGNKHQWLLTFPKIEITIHYVPLGGSTPYHL